MFFIYKTNTVCDRLHVYFLVNLGKNDHHAAVFVSTVSDTVNTMRTVDTVGDLT
jgi:hypothetical protein